MSEAEPEPDADEAPRTEAVEPPARARGGGRLVAAVALLLAIVALAGAAWLGWHQYRDMHARAALAAQVAALGKRLDETSTRLQSAQRAQEARVHELDTAFASLRTRLGGDRGGWIVAEAEYLLSIANQRARLSGDRTTALAALRAADRRLAVLADPAFHPVRVRIAQEISALKALPAVDRAGLDARLEALIRQAATLPVAGSAAAPVAHPGKAGGAGTHGWREALKALGTSLRSLVVIRRVDHPPQPMLAPDQRWFLHQNLRLELEGARLALLQGDAAGYRSSLKTAGRWVAAYFDRQAPATRAVDGELQKLAAAPVAVKLPDLSGSLRLLRRLAASRYETPGAAGAGQ